MVEEQADNSTFRIVLTNMVEEQADNSNRTVTMLLLSRSTVLTPHMVEEQAERTVNSSSQRSWWKRKQ